MSSGEGKADPTVGLFGDVVSTPQPPPPATKAPLPKPKGPQVPPPTGPSGDAVYQLFEPTVANPTWRHDILSILRYRMGAHMGAIGSPLLENWKRLPAAKAAACMPRKQVTTAKMASDIVGRIRKAVAEANPAELAPPPGYGNGDWVRRFCTAEHDC